MRQETGYLAPLRQQTANALEWPLSCIELVQRCTDLIDELQRERGLGQLVLSSVGESYAAALREQLTRLGLALLNSPGLADLLPMRRCLLLRRRLAVAAAD